jgi:hypothetical protein
MNLACEVAAEAKMNLAREIVAGRCDRGYSSRVVDRSVDRSVSPLFSNHNGAR